MARYLTPPLFSFIVPRQSSTKSTSESVNKNILNITGKRRFKKEIPANIRFQSSSSPGPRLKLEALQPIIGHGCNANLAEKQKQKPARVLSNCVSTAGGRACAWSLFKSPVLSIFDFLHFAGY